MHRLTSAQFKPAVELDPAWASKLTEPVEITDYCDMAGSEITHLSPFLHFTGKNEDGWSAKFSGCASLKIAEGRFEGYVSFCFSGIETIGDLSCGRDEDGDSVYFNNCKSLKVAEGKFEGYASFYQSSIEKIGDLSCGRNNKGDSASFWNCKSLKVARGEFSGRAYFRGSGIETIGDLSCEKNNEGIRLDVKDCPNLKSIPFTFNPKGVKADPGLVRNLTKTRAFIQKKRAEVVEIGL